MCESPRNKTPLCFDNSLKVTIPDGLTDFYSSKQNMQLRHTAPENSMPTELPISLAPVHRERVGQPQSFFHFF